MKHLFFALAAALGTLAAHADSIAYANTIEILPADDAATIVAKAAHVVPSARQLDALDREFIGFIHIGPNTFTRREWGTGTEDPSIFDLHTLDTDQWVRTMRDAGMKLVILTVKHHDGFVLWQSRYTGHGIMNSPFEGGKGDILRNLSESCRKYGMKLGVYLSPADLYQIEHPQGLYGNGSKATERVIPREVEGRPFADKRTFTYTVDDYNEYFLNQLFELLTEYGPIHEVWFDGAHPKSKGGQTYNNHAWISMIRALAPEAVIFGRQDVRWCGNEAGDTRPSEWNVIPFDANPDSMGTFPDLTDADLGSREKLQGARFLHYQQPETDTSIREGWFYRDDTYQRTRSADDVFDIYERSAGGNATFLLNVPPNREGRFSDTDVAVLTEVGRRITATYGTSLLNGASGPEALLDGDVRNTYIDITEPVTISTATPVTINRIVLCEPISERGERIESHAVDAFIDGEWKEIAAATNVGHKRILRFATITTDSLRIRITASRLTPALSEVSAHYYATGAPELSVSKSADGRVKIEPKRAEFGWKRSATNSTAALADGFIIRYTTDGSEPSESSPVYSEAFSHPAPCVVKAAAWLNGKRGAVTTEQTGLPATELTFDDDVAKAFDGETATSCTIDATRGLTIKYAGKRRVLNGFAYTPPQGTDRGLISAGEILVSDDGRRWRHAADFEFGNLINDPTRRFFRFAKPVSTRYIRIMPKATAGNNGEPAVAELMLF